VIVNLSGYFLYLFSKIVTRTCKFHIEGLEIIEEIKIQGKPVIITSWHGMTMMIIALLNKRFDITNFVGIMPDDHRGDVLGVFAEHLGVKAVALNLAGDSTLGSSRRLIRVINEIKKGRNSVIHPDGPAGPAYKVKPGLSFIAKKSGAKVLPVGCYCRNAYHIPRWDRYTLPLPFSSVHLQLGELIDVTDEIGDLEEFDLALGDILNQLTLQAAANYYELSG
jgi:lysophospholipid acyltransferase (LPLAT)-like uncharacterized protein